MTRQTKYQLFAAFFLVLFVAGGLISKGLVDLEKASGSVKAMSSKAADADHDSEKEGSKALQITSSFLVSASPLSTIDLHAALFLVKSLSVVAFVPTSVQAETQIDLLSYFENLFTHTICINAP